MWQPASLDAWPSVILSRDTFLATSCPAFHWTPLAGFLVPVHLYNVVTRTHMYDTSLTQKDPIVSVSPSPLPQILIVSLRLLWGPLSPLVTSCCCIVMYWTFAMIGEVWLAVNLFRVFLVVEVRSLRWMMSSSLPYAAGPLQQPQPWEGLQNSLPDSIVCDVHLSSCER